MRYYAKLTDEQILKLLNVITHVLFFTIPLTMILLVCCSCGSTKDTIKQVVEHVSVDTLYLNRIQYDSIFIQNDHSLEYHPFQTVQNHSEPFRTDTIFQKDVSIEYRYRLLKDTTYIHQIDSIPIIKEVEVTKEIPYIPWYSKFLSWVGAVAIGILLFFILRIFIKKTIIPKL